MSSLSLEHEASAGDGEVGAGEASGEQFDGFDADIYFANIRDDREAGAAVRDDPPAVGVGLARPDCPMAGGFKAEVKSEAA